MTEAFEAMAFTAHLPNRVLVFITPKGTPVTGGIFKIERVRTATEVDDGAYPLPPDGKCCLCGAPECDQ